MLVLKKTKGGMTIRIHGHLPQRDVTHLAWRTERNWAALEAAWMQNSDWELLNQHFPFHLGAERKAFGRGEEGKGKEGARWEGR